MSKNLGRAVPDRIHYYYLFFQVFMVTWGIGSVVLNPSICPSICSSMINATRRAETRDEQDVLFDYTGIYVSEKSLLAPVMWASRLLGGMAMYPAHSS